MAKIAPYPYYQLFDDNGDPLAGGKVSTFETGTTVNKTTFTDEGEGTANANPVLLDANGRADIWLGSGAYTFVVKTSAGVTIKTVDDITGDAAGLIYSTVVSISTNTAIVAGNQNNLIECTAALTLSLLAAATAESGFTFSVKNSGSGNVIIDPDAAELIDGVSTITIFPGESALITVNTDSTGWISSYLDTVSLTDNNTFTGSNTFTGDIVIPSDSTLTIATGSITPTGAKHLIDTESSAATDDLATIVAGNDGDILIISAVNTARTIVVKDGTGNIQTANGKDITLDTTEKLLTPQFSTTLSAWLVLSSPEPAVVVQSALSGLLLSSDTDTDHDINITAGQAADSTNASYLTLSSEITKQIDATWVAGDDAGGLFTGTVANSTVYFIHIIEKDSDGSIDAGFDTSITAANIPTGYTKFTNIGAIITDGSANISYIAHYRSDKQYVETGLNTITAAGALTNAHLLTGVTTNSLIELNYFIKNNSTEGNYSAGDIVPVDGFDFSSTVNTSSGVSSVIDATNIVSRYSDRTNTFSILNKTTGVLFNIANTKWDLIIRAEYRK